MAPSMVCALSWWWPLPGHIDIVNTLCDIQELSVLQSVDWGALAFSIVLVELDGKNTTKDTGVRHLLAAQGHVYYLVKVPPVPCQHRRHIPRGSGFCCSCSLPSSPKHPKQPRHPPGHRQHRCTMGAQAPSAAPRSGATPASSDVTCVKAHQPPKHTAKTSRAEPHPSGGVREARP